LKKSFIGILLVLGLVLALGLAGCGKSDTTGDNGGKLEGSITVAGSTSVQPFSEVLAEKFMAKNPGTKVNVQGGGSSQGLEAAKTGTAEIGSSSRELTDEEKSGLKEFVIAKDGIAIVVNPANTLTDLTIAQLRDIYSGKVTNWKEVGGPNAKITLVIREAGSGTRDGFESMVMNKEPVDSKALVSNSTGAVKTTVAGDPNAIGYMSLASVDDTVKALSVEKVQPSESTVSSEEYKLTRPFIYVTKDEPTGLAKAFIDYVLSDEGQTILAGEGAVRIN
jgi:phosphate transport system substrate-binding protein